MPARSVVPDAPLDQWQGPVEPGSQGPITGDYLERPRSESGRKLCGLSDDADRRSADVASEW
jgi:hypothetical protein